MMKKMLVLSLVLSLVSAISAEVNFDQNTNTKEIISASHNEAHTPMPTPVPGPFSRYTRDCARFTFGPSNNEIMSDRVWLTSKEYVQECHTYYVQHANGGELTPHVSCYERPGMTWHEQIQMNVKARKLFPWEKETFEVCLEGPWMNIYKSEAAYKYSTKTVGNLFELTPQYKVAMDPDLAGLEIGEISYNKETEKYTFKVNDKWAKEYAGEKIAIKVELKKSILNWFDSSKGEKEFTFDVSSSYTMTFSENELIKSKQEQSNDHRLFGSKGKYLKWGFKRLGKISTDRFMDKGDTPVIQVK